MRGVFMPVGNPASFLLAGCFEGVKFRVNAFALRTSAIISFRCSSVSLAFFALPPRLPIATAALFFIGVGQGSRKYFLQLPRHPGHLKLQDAGAE
jgi:hypothetical protein